MMGQQNMVTTWCVTVPGGRAGGAGGGEGGGGEGGGAGGGGDGKRFTHLEGARPVIAGRQHRATYDEHSMRGSLYMMCIIHPCAGLATFQPRLLERGFERQTGPGCGRTDMITSLCSSHLLSNHTSSERHVPTSGEHGATQPLRNASLLRWKHVE